ncbi:MAG: NTP transferase domain-containing protein [Odoribacteraceae bacterium]|jgi:NDP-sugar pyrophosphorylase family protein|nr:NTP transferase domain-containing protein [Odoribacteraceae bacterium]
MILAAGLGTRLRPLTDDRPKALVEVRGKTLLHHAIERLAAAGVTRLVINIHHRADQVEEYLRRRHNFGIDIRLSDERDALLDTGGAILRARPLLLPGLPLLVHNVDIISDVDLPLLARQHADSRARATLVTRRPATDRLLRFDADNTLTGWENRATGQRLVANRRDRHALPRAFCGIQILSPAYLDAIHHRGAFSIIDEHLHQARRHAIRAFHHDGQCADAGTPAAIAALDAYLPDSR